MVHSEWPAQGSWESIPLPVGVLSAPTLSRKRSLANLGPPPGKAVFRAPTVTVAQLSTGLHSLGLSLEDSLAHRQAVVITPQDPQ